MAVTNWGAADTVPLSSILADIERGRLVLPEFQRDWKWDDGRIIKLIASLLSSYPAGSLMFWEADRDTVQTRAINNAPPPAPAGPQTLILDGQQRLTALWTALKSGDNSERKFYLRIDALLKLHEHPPKNDASWGEAFNEMVERRKPKRGKKHTVGPFPDRSEEISEQILPIEELAPGAGVIQWLYDWAEFHKVSHRYRDALINQLKDFSNYQFPVIYLNATNTLAAVCNIFETVNSQGVVLGPYDLLAARWYKDVKLRDLWEDNVRDDLKKALGGDPYPILQIHSLVSTGDQCLTSAKVTPSATRPDVMDLAAKTTEANWAPVIRALSDTVKLLRNDCGWSSPSSMPYPPLLNTMTAWTFLTQKLPPKERAKAVILSQRLYFASVFTQNYDQGSTSAMGRDVKALARSTRDQTPLAGAVEDFVPDSFAAMIRNESMSAKAVLGSVLLLVSGAHAKDFYTGGGLFDKARVAEDGVDKHHIFPKAFLKSQGEPKDRANVVANVTYLRDDSNQAIGSSAPSVYLHASEKLGHNVAELLRRHAIGPDALAAMRRDDFSSFLEARSRYLAEAADLLVKGGISIEDAVLRVTA